MSLHIRPFPGSTYEEASSRINFDWLLRLRWILITGQILLITLTHVWFKISLPMGKLFGLIAVASLTNLALHFWQRRKPQIQEWMLGVVMLLDLLLLTGLFYWTGGPANPFSFLYLVYIAMGIVVLQARWMWVVSVWTLLCYGSLFVGWDSSSHHAVHDPKAMQLHLEGMWLAYAMTTILIGYFVTRMKRALNEREKELMVLYDQQQRYEKLATLAAMAGETVHEMATPLATIAVISKELEHELQHKECAAEMIKDACMIREQVDICHELLQELAMHSGENLGETNQTMTLDSLFMSVLTGFTGASRVRLEVIEELAHKQVTVPVKALRRVLHNLLNNALEASEQGQGVVLKADMHDQILSVSVVDRGRGIPSEMLPRLGEPFVTTKQGGLGHGLGVFLAKTLTERLGGTWHLRSQSGQGTTVTMEFPGMLVGGTLR